MLKNTTLGARRYRITTIWANSADDKKKKKKIVICFITKKTGFDISCNGDNLHEMQILFPWKNDKNISKCLLKTLPRMLSVMVCRNKSRMGLCTVKPITCTKRRISLHTLSLHISSLIRAFANRMSRLQSMGLTKRLVRRAKTRVSLRNCTQINLRIRMCVDDITSRRLFYMVEKCLRVQLYESE